MLMQLCFKVITNKKNQDVRTADSGRRCGIHYYGFLHNMHFNMHKKKICNMYVYEKKMFLEHFLALFKFN